MSVRANLLKDRGFAANSIPITPSAKKIVLTEGYKAGFKYRGASYLMQRNQFLRLFLCEREIIVNALFLLICLGSGKAKSTCKDTNNNLNNAQISNYFFLIRKQQGQRKDHDDANDGYTSLFTHTL